MSLTDLIYLSQKSLRSNILRSVLTSLGIIIGVSSVITMISIGSGARQEVEEQIERFGSNNLIVRSQSSSSRGVSMGANSVNTLTLEDMEALKNELPAISAIAPRVSLSTQIIANGNNWLTTVSGSTNDYFELGNWKFETGREFQEDEINFMVSWLQDRGENVPDLNHMHHMNMPMNTRHCQMLKWSMPRQVLTCNLPLISIPNTLIGSLMNMKDLQDTSRLNLPYWHLLTCWKKVNMDLLKTKSKKQLK